MIPDKFLPPPMSTGKKIWLGILSIVPGFMFMAYIFLFFASAFMDVSSGRHDAGIPKTMFLGMFLMFVGFIMTTAITIYHVIHISKNYMMSSNDKLVWILVVLLLPWIGDVIYWYVKIWKDPKPDPTKSNFF
jgi:hypothetical protein